ncbi:PH domain-containing protein [Patescibacteria group bacterium]|nr:PH domain-containing protein [Patescibacteria group bacterium]
MYQLHPKAKWLFFFRSFIGALTTFIIIFVFAIIPTLLSNGSGTFTFLVISFVVFLIIAILSYIIATLNYKFYKFELTEDAYKSERGIIHKRYISIPYERIQNVDIHRSLLARMLGLSELLIHTAGYGAAGSKGTGSEGKLPGLSVEDTEKVRDALIQMAKGKKESGL